MHNAAAYRVEIIKQNSASRRLAEVQKSMCHISDGKMQVSWSLLHCGRLLSTELWLPTP